MRAVEGSLEELKASLTAPVLEKDWMGWSEVDFAWDQKRFLSELRPRDSEVNYSFRFWTQDDAWDRREAADKSSVSFVRTPGPARLWRHLFLFDFSYLRLTPHRYWWGLSGSSQSTSLVPPDQVAWRKLGVETFGGETCDVVDSTQRTQRLWIGRSSGRVRGALTYYVAGAAERYDKFYESDSIRRIAGKTFEDAQEFGRWHYSGATAEQLIKVAIAWSELYPKPFAAEIEPRELAVFEDYREVSPGLWLPFRENRAYTRPSVGVPDKMSLTRSELVVERVRTDRDLGDRYASLLPKEGDRVQDQRFIFPVDYRYAASRVDEEIQKQAQAEYSRLLSEPRQIKRLIDPLAAMVGKPAPALPVAGWIGARPADVTGRPYLLHFWATWYDPCVADLPQLSALAKKGAIVLGMHPSGTTAAEIEKLAKDHRLTYPTFLASGKEGAGIDATIGGYPAAVFPYCILVDAQGKVAGAGLLSEVMRKVGVSALIPRPKG